MTNVVVCIFLKSKMTPHFKAFKKVIKNRFENIMETAEKNIIDL